VITYLSIAAPAENIFSQLHTSPCCTYPSPFYPGRPLLSVLDENECLGLNASVGEGKPCWVDTKSGGMSVLSVLSCSPNWTGSLVALLVMRGTSRDLSSSFRLTLNSDQVIPVVSYTHYDLYIPYTSPHRLYAPSNVASNIMPPKS
jgi:hypothetical protein